MPLNSVKLTTVSEPPLIVIFDVYGTLLDIALPVAALEDDTGPDRRACRIFGGHLDLKEPGSAR